MRFLFSFLILMFSFHQIYSQNVGIGTNNPTAKLEINKAGKADLKLKSANFTDTTQIILSNRNGSFGTDFIISSNQESGLRISSLSDISSNINPNILDIKPSGRIGLGSANPDGKLQVNHTATLSNPSFMILDSSYSNVGGGILKFRNITGLNSLNLKASIGLQSTGVDTYFDFMKDNSIIMSLRGDGNLGIGGAGIDPDLGALIVRKKVGNVHAIFGDNVAGVSLESDNPGIHLNSYFNASRKVLATGYTSGMEMDESVGSLLFYTSPSSTPTGGTTSVFSRMVIKRDGNIGINFINPTDRLEVDGNIAIRGTNLFEFGKGVVGKEVNAGKIGYNAFGQTALTVIGGGTSSTNRRIYFFTEGGAAFNGNIEALTSITVGTTTLPAGYKLSVDGKIIAEELRVQNSTAWPDYVFEKTYDLMSLKELEKIITLHKHLPEVPSANDVARDGVAVGEMQKILLKKIEELTLHIIAQEKRIEQLEIQLKK